MNGTDICGRGGGGRGGSGGGNEAGSRKRWWGVCTEMHASRARALSSLRVCLRARTRPPEAADLQPFQPHHPQLAQTLHTRPLPPTVRPIPLPVRRCRRHPDSRVGWLVVVVPALAVDEVALGDVEEDVAGDGDDDRGLEGDAHDARGIVSTSDTPGVSTDTLSQVR